jgi:predicted lipoprotein with Yx(FWY)xxD motif
MRPSSRWTYLAGIGVGIALDRRGVLLGRHAQPPRYSGRRRRPPPATTAPERRERHGRHQRSPTLGAYLTGQNGMTLYVLTKDTPDTSTCTGTCATNWPPLTVASGATVSGPAAATDAFGTITRSDGTTQVTYNHMPLYYYSRRLGRRRHQRRGQARRLVRGPTQRNGHIGPGPPGARIDHGARPRPAATTAATELGGSDRLPIPVRTRRTPDRRVLSMRREPASNASAMAR